MNQYYAYIRVSTTRQGEQGVSLQQQREAIERYAQRNHLDINRWFEEQETAAKQGRPQFGEMVRLLRRRYAHGVIIHKIDRSARNLRDWADLGQLIDSGIDVHFANEALDLTSRGGRLSADIQAVVAADYVRNLREESKKGIYGRLKQGFFPMPAPLGYLNNGQAKAKTLDPQTAPLVRRAFELYSTTRFNLSTLSQELHRLGLRRKDGSPIHRNRLSDILNNPFYYGLIHIKKSNQSFEGVHEPLISKRLFDQVQAVLTGKINTRSVKHDFLYRRRLTCKNCEYSLIGETQKGYIYYRCQTPDCPTTSVREETVEAAVLHKFSFLRFSPDECRYVSQELAALRAQSGKQQEQMVNALELRLAQLDDRLSRLTDAYLEQVLDRDLFEQRKTALLSERRDLRSQLGSWQVGRCSVSEELEKILERADTAYLAYKQAQTDEKRDMLATLTSNRLVDAKTPVIMLALPFSEIANRWECTSGGPRRDIHRTWGRLLPMLLNLVQRKQESQEKIAA